MQAYRQRVEAGLELLAAFIQAEGLEAELGPYYRAAREARYAFDDWVIRANPDAAAHTKVSPWGGPATIVFNTHFLNDPSLYFLAFTLVHEGVHAARGFWSTNLVPILKEVEPNRVAPDTLKARLARFERARRGR